MIKYRAGLSGIKEVDVVKETKSFITTATYCSFSERYMDRKEARESSDHGYFNTFEEARQWSINALDNLIQNHQRGIDSLKSQKQKINNMKIGDK